MLKTHAYMLNYSPTPPTKNNFQINYYKNFFDKLQCLLYIYISTLDFLTLVAFV